MNRKSLRLRPRPAFVLDANLFLVFLVGALGPRALGVHKRTHGYRAADFSLLKRLLEPARSLLTTPTILAEVSNLARQTSEPLRSRISMNLRALLNEVNRGSKVDEHYRASAALTLDGVYLELGLTDAAIVELALAKGPAPVHVLTADFSLYQELRRHGASVTNFAYAQQQAGLLPR